MLAASSEIYTVSFLCVRGELFHTHETRPKIMDMCMLNYYGQRSHGKTKDSKLNGGWSLVGNCSQIFKVVQNMKRVMHYQTIYFTPLIKILTSSI
jgi:hypothetical protein